MTDWSRIRQLAEAGEYAADIARAVGWHGDASNLKVAARRRGIEIRAMSTTERARRAGRIGGRHPKRKTRPVGADVPHVANVNDAIRKLLEVA